MLTKEQILGVKDLKIEEIEVPEWGTEDEPGIIYLQELSAEDRDLWERKVFNDKDGQNFCKMKNVRANLIAQCMVDQETRERLFDQNSIPALAQKAASVMERLFEECLRINAIRKKDVDELEEN